MSSEIDDRLHEESVWRANAYIDHLLHSQYTRLDGGLLRKPDEYHEHGHLVVINSCALTEIFIDGYRAFFTEHSPDWKIRQS
jgi:hypothetical protein